METVTLSEASPQAQARLDYQPVEALLNELRHRQKLADSTRKWLAAFTTFKGELRRHGLLVDDENEKRAFLKIVSDLIRMGCGLLAQMGDEAPGILNEAGIGLDNFNACLEMLELEERAVSRPLDAETVAKLNAVFGT